MSKLTFTLIAVGAALALAIVGYSVINSAKQPARVTNVQPETSRVANASDIEPKLHGVKTSASIGSEWRWKELESTATTAEEEETETPFTPQSVYDALQAVKLDENGNVVLDHDALVSLDEALERIYNQLDDQSANALRELIESALPGKAGQQTAELVDNYRQFLRAKEEFSQMYENTTGQYRETSIESLNSDQRLYSELQALREVYLGNQAATALFEVSDANAHYMFESMKLGLDDTLSVEDRLAKQKELEQQLQNKTAPQASLK